MEKHIKYFENKIQKKLEQLPRAINGKAPKKHLLKILDEIGYLQDAKLALTIPVVSGTFNGKLIKNFKEWMKDENIEKIELYLYGDTYYSFEEIFNTYKSNLNLKP